MDKYINFICRNGETRFGRMCFSQHLFPFLMRINVAANTRSMLIGMIAWGPPIHRLIYCLQHVGQPIRLIKT